MIFVHIIVSFYRANLANVVLQLLALNVKDVLNFDFMDPPTKEVKEITYIVFFYLKK